MCETKILLTDWSSEIGPHQFTDTYYGDLKVGGVDQTVVFDTQTEPSGVFSIYCRSCYDYRKNPFDPKESSDYDGTMIDEGMSSLIGEYTGNRSHDLFSSDEGNWSVRSPFLLITEGKAKYQQPVEDMILSLPIGQPDHSGSLVQELYDAGSISVPWFGF